MINVILIVNVSKKIKFKLSLRLFNEEKRMLACFDIELPMQDKCGC